MKKTSTRLTTHLAILIIVVTASQLSANAQTITSNANVALYKPATASTFQTDKYVVNAFDGNAATRWSSLYSDNEWISVDLGQMYSVNQVVLIWERAYGKDFNILFSRDGSFTDLNDKTIQVLGNVLGSDSIAGTNTIKVEENTIARYVRMQGVHRATVFGYSLYEFRVAGSTEVSGLLPVTLSGFTATEENSTTVLQWITTTENNTAGFSIERSTDGANFTAIGWVDGTNRGTVISHYSYTDKQISSGRNYYRLKVFDLTGKAGATPAVAINVAGSNSLKIYPIPVKDHLAIEYSGTPGENVSISLFNTCGQPVYNYKTIMRGSQQTMMINRNGNMVPGIYFLTVSSTNNVSYTEQIVLQ